MLTQCFSFSTAETEWTSHCIGSVQGHEKQKYEQGAQKCRLSFLKAFACRAVLWAGLMGKEAALKHFVSVEMLHLLTDFLTYLYWNLYTVMCILLLMKYILLKIVKKL